MTAMMQKTTTKKQMTTQQSNNNQIDYRESVYGGEDDGEGKVSGEATASNVL